MPSPRLDDADMKEINRIGRDTGCHRCGITEPGTVSGNFVPEYHPPHAWGKSKIVIPCCLACSRSTGAIITSFLYGKRP